MMEVKRLKSALQAKGGALTVDAQKHQEMPVLVLVDHLDKIFMVLKMLWKVAASDIGWITAISACTSEPSTT